ncbi:TonB-dependent receptor [Caulobacter sp. 17J80-11]|uniref:TonB-dependent receptor n=1 Tax=Caulobacter sp. 17J80-11 TaxID=2763502 RepID=UPI001653964D|nr:TonB-dependent receptor [Caulobacter sp. 17J80-11]MBC6983609.1 TonB-dependent receptor [Caulobacter sp. 17J80-11]
MSFVALSALLAAASASAEPAAVEELVVTAQKREQRLIDAPLSVAVVTGEAMERSGGRDLKDLQTLTSGLIVTSTANETQTTARLRGVGTVGDNPGLESSVGVVIDGVYRPRTGTAINDLGELDRIEILKGPQGTLFGKNASAGLISVLTAAPEFNTYLEAEATVGELGTRGASLTLNAPITDTLAGRLFVARRLRDGIYDVRTGDGPRTERQDNNQDYWTARGQLLFTPSDDAEIRVIADYTKREENCCAGVMLVRGPTAAWIDGLAADEGVAPTPNPGARTAWSNRSTAQQIEDAGLSVQLDLDLGAATLTSITAARSWSTKNGYDADFSTADIYYRDPDGSFGSEFATLSQELRLAGKRDALDWMVGAFLAAEDVERRDEYLYGADYETYLGLLLTGGANPNRVSEITGFAPGAAFVAGEGARDTYRQEARTLALFTNDTWRLTERLELTAGLRFTAEDKDLASTWRTTDGGAACAAAKAAATGVSVLCLPWSNGAFNGTSHQSRSETAWSGTLKASWRLSDEAVTYASWARGWKAGGFNLDREQTAYLLDADTAFEDERVDAYELGAKTRWFDGALAVDAAVFRQEFQDFQLNTFANATFVVRSVPELTSTGAEVEARWATPLDGLNLSGGVTYAETEFGSDPVTGLVRLPGSRSAFAPLWSAAAAADWSRPIGHGLEAGAWLSGKFNSDYNTGSDLNPLKIQPAFWRADARVWVGAADGRWAAELWARNLTDELYRQVAFDAPLQAGTVNAFLGEPRSVGVTVRVRR